MPEQNPNPRRGALTVEFALTAPLLFLFVFAGIEFARINMIRNTIQNAAYEGARCGVLPGAVAGDCQTAAEDVLAMVRITGYSVDVTPITPTTTSVTVTVEVPITASQGYVTPRFYLGRTLRASVTFPRESG